jgi:hypothetical protein
MVENMGDLEGGFDKFEMGEEFVRFEIDHDHFRNLVGRCRDDCAASS